MVGNAAGAPTGHAGESTVGRACMDSTVSPTSADLQMSSLMDRDRANTINSSMRETWHYLFVLSLFLAKFRCCIHMPLAGFFCAVEFGKWISRSSCCTLLRSEHWIRVLPVPVGLVCEDGTCTSVLHQLCAWREYTISHSYHFLSWLHLSELLHRQRAHMRWVNSTWGQWEPFYWLQSRAFRTACSSPNSTYSNVTQQTGLTVQSPLQNSNSRMSPVQQTLDYIQAT